MKTSKPTTLHAPKAVADAKAKLQRHFDEVLSALSGRPAVFEERSDAQVAEGEGPMIKVAVGKLNEAVDHTITALRVVKSKFGKE